MTTFSDNVFNCSFRSKLPIYDAFSFLRSAQKYKNPSIRIFFTENFQEQKKWCVQNLISIIHCGICQIFFKCTQRQHLNWAAPHITTHTSLTLNTSPEFKIDVEFKMIWHDGSIICKVSISAQTSKIISVITSLQLDLITVKISDRLLNITEILWTLNYILKKFSPRKIKTSQDDLFKHSVWHVENCIFLHYLLQKQPGVLTAQSHGTVGG